MIKLVAGSVRSSNLRMAFFRDLKGNIIESMEDYWTEA
jgi:hypothetical protein